MITSTAYERVVLLRIERAERRNALNTEHCRLLRDAVESAVSAGARALVITGQGSSFCSGADFDEVYSKGFREALYAALSAVSGAPLPVIAAVNGPAIGAGTQLAIACDFRVAAPSARFAVPTARLGLAVDPWTIRRLALVAGHQAARGMLMACTEYDADAALAAGLVDRIGDSATEIADSALEWAAELADLAPLTVRYNKRVLDAAVATGSAEAALEEELLVAFESCWTSEDVAEGRAARLESRRPEFHGH